MRLWDTAERIMEDTMRDDPTQPIIEKCFGLVLLIGTLLLSALLLIGLTVTSPIWGLPYLIYKARREE